MEQARPIAPADRVEVTAKRLQARRDSSPPPHGVELATEWPRDLLSPAGVRGHGFEDGGHVVEPGGALLSRLGARSPGRQSRLEALIQLGAARLIALCSQGQTAPSYPVESLIRLRARQAKGRAAFEG